MGLNSNLRLEARKALSRSSTPAEKESEAQLLLSFLFSNLLTLGPSTFPSMHPVLD